MEERKLRDGRTVERVREDISVRKKQWFGGHYWALKNGGGTRLAAHGDLAGESSLDFHALQPPLRLLGNLLLVLVRYAQRHLLLLSPSHCVRLLLGTRYRE